MDFDPRDVRGLMGHGVRHDFANMPGQRLVTVDVMVGFDLDLHLGDSPSSAISRLWGKDPLGRQMLHYPVAINTGGFNRPSTKEHPHVAMEFGVLCDGRFIVWYYHIVICQ